MLKNSLYTLFCMLPFLTTAQVDTTEVVIDSVYVDIDTTLVVDAENIITNTSALDLFFEKLYLLDTEKQGKINIVHVRLEHYGLRACGKVKAPGVARRDHLDGIEYIRFVPHIGLNGKIFACGERDTAQPYLHAGFGKRNVPAALP